MALVTLTAQQQADLKEAMLVNYELIIRDMAGNVVSLCQSRKDHPSYGTTKAQIKKALHQMEGVIGAYMVLAGQANHPFVAAVASFLDDATTDRVHEARGRVMGL